MQIRATDVWRMSGFNLNIGKATFLMIAVTLKIGPRSNKTPKLDADIWTLTTRH